MACRVLICLLLFCTFVRAEESRVSRGQASLPAEILQEFPSPRSITLSLPPELQQKLACQSQSDEQAEQKDPNKIFGESEKNTSSNDSMSAAKIAPGNDRCENAQPITFGTIVSETCSATRDGSTSCQSSSNAPDIWYVVTPEDNATIALNTFGSNYDTLLSVHTGCPGTVTNQIVCSDDCGSPDSCVTFNVIAGTSYWIRVGGFQQDAGRTSLSISKQGSFGGRITDANTNQGIAETQVLVYTKDAEFVKSASSDADGNYVADGLADGKYIARTFNPAGYVDEVFENIVCEGLTCTPDGATLINVTGGGFTQVSFALDLGGDIRGTLNDAETGDPIEGVEVHIHDLSNVHISAGFTDSAGRYDTLDGLPSGQYIVIAFNHDGFVDELYDDVPCVRGVCSTALATKIDISLGAVIDNINFVLDPGGRIIGTITDVDTQQPVSGVQVVIHNFTGTRISSASSDSSGNFISFDGLPTGNYFVRTNNFKHYIDELHDDKVCPSGTCTPTTGTPVPLTVGSESEVNFALNFGAIISGKITDDTTNEPLTGILVDLFDASGNRLNLASPDFAGNYSSLIGLPEGTYFLKTLNQRGYLDELHSEIPCVASRCNPLAGTPIFVKPGNNANDINFALSKGSAVSGRIEESANGLPLSDIFVLMFDSNFFLSSFGVTDGCGEYSSLHGMLGSKYIVTTDNSFGFIDEVYDDVLCLNGCDFLKGRPVPLNFGERASNIDFDLSFMLLRDDFQDSVMDWKVKSGEWTEQESFLRGSTNSSMKKASASVPLPWDPSGASSCSRCTMETAVKIDGGNAGKLTIHAWRQNSSNRVELSIREDTGKWKLKQLFNGTLVASKNKTLAVDFDVTYRIKLRYDGSQFQLWVDDSLLMSMESPVSPTGTAGFELKNTSASFDYILIY